MDFDPSGNNLFIADKGNSRILLYNLTNSEKNIFILNENIENPFGNNNNNSIIIDLFKRNSCF